jgi:hypothetical protein
MCMIEWLLDRNVKYKLTGIVIYTCCSEHGVTFNPLTTPLFTYMSYDINSRRKELLFIELMASSESPFAMQRLEVRPSLIQLVVRTVLTDQYV